MFRGGRATIIPPNLLMRSNNTLINVNVELTRLRYAVEVAEDPYSGRAATLLTLA
jgi:hypothetical protein